jgi:hypothetical protein
MFYFVVDASLTLLFSFCSRVAGPVSLRLVIVFLPEFVRPRLPSGLSSCHPSGLGAASHYLYCIVSLCSLFQG